MILTLGYVRVSSIEQEQGFGPEAQTEAIRAYAKSKGLSTPELHYESKSGESIIDRLELHLVLARAENVMEGGGEAHVIVYSLDRLTRNLIDQESVVLRCMETGVRLHSTLPAENDTLDPVYAGDPARTMIRQFFGIFHQFDRAVIKRRLDSGLTRKAAQGGFCGGRVPFGYRSVNQELEVDPDQAATVCRAFQLLDAGINKTTTAAILVREYPELCGHWKTSQITRLSQRRELYEGGIYRPRGGAQAMQRPDLVILRSEYRRKAQAAGDLDLETIPDPVRLSGLAILFDTPEPELREIISKKRIMVRWRGNSPLVPKDSVRRLYEAVKNQIDF